MRSPDPLDRKLIALLRENPQATNKAIAAKLEVSETTIALRIRSLWEDNLMRVIVQKDISFDGAPLSCRVFIDTEGNDAVSIGEELASIEETTAIALGVSGPHLVAIFLVRDLEHMADIIEQDINNVQGVKSVHFEAITRIYKYDVRYAYLKINPAKVPVYSGPDRDRAIVSELMQDGRMSYREVARRIDISESNVRRRLNNLTSSGKIRFAVVEDISASNFSALAIIRVSIRAKEQAVFVEQMKKLPEIYFVGASSGDYNIALGIACRDTLDLSRVIKEQIRPHPTLLDLDVILTVDPIKSRYDITKIL